MSCVKPPKDKILEDVYVRAHPGAKRALERALADLKPLRKREFGGHKITQERVICASWLWLAELAEADAAGLAERLAPHVAHYASLIREAEAPPRGAPAERENVSSQVKARKPGADRKGRKGA